MTGKAPGPMIQDGSVTATQLGTNSFCFVLHGAFLGLHR